MKKRLCLVGFTLSIVAVPEASSYAPPPISESACALEARREIDAGVATLNTTAIEVLHEGEPIYRYGDVSRTDGLYVASVRKSLLALLYGPWVENGTINLDTTLEELEIDDVEGLSSTEKQATIRDLISSRSGIYHPASNGGDDPNKPARGTHPPGEFFVYNNWDFNAAGSIFEQLTGENIHDAFNEQIAKSIDLQDYDLEVNKQKRAKSDPNSGSIFPSYHFTLSARDMAKIGHLVAQRGMWNGTQVLSEEWIEEMLREHSTLQEVQARRNMPFAYGYMWWLPQGAFLPEVVRGSAMANGAWGQYILANPELQLAAGHVTEPQPVVDASERAKVSTGAGQFATIVQSAWEAYLDCGTLIAN